MQAIHGVRRSPLAVILVLGALLLTLLIGGVGGYLVKGALGSPVQDARSAFVRTQSTPYIYVQGGRPSNVYEQAAQTPSIYVQGGRPQIVYDEIARLEKK